METKTSETGAGVRYETTGRLLSLDVFRGLTIAAMLLVNTPGSWSHVYAPLRHAPWHGWTPTDLIFPFFLFIVGVTTHLSLTARLHRGDSPQAIAGKVLRRGVIIFLLGILLHWFPFVTIGAVDGVDSASVWMRMEEKLRHLRIPGVLQRIAVVYLFAAAWVWWRRDDREWPVARWTEWTLLGSILLGYWALLVLVPVGGGGGGIDDPSATIVAWVDRQVLGEAHLWRQTKLWDPEGVLSTIPAFVTGILGVFTGRLLSSNRTLHQKVATMAVAGVTGTAAGLVWSFVLPINKNLWTGSYVLLAGGLAAVTLAACIYLVDVRRWRWWTGPLVAFGVNPILAFLGSGLVARTMGLIRVPVEDESISLHLYLYRNLFAGWLEPKNASLGFAVAYVMLWLAILWPLWRRRIHLKV